MAETLSLPGFVDAHSHGFQRALRGRAGGADFWGWREVMLAEAERQTPELVRREYVQVYRELRAAGYTAVGEFHYLGFDEALAAVAAAQEAELRIVVMLAAYGRGGLPRFRQASVAEYLKQIDDLRPIELLDACGCLGPRTTVVHATHADGHELDLLAAAGARVCACPTTEANLGDGFLPVERIRTRGIALCIGSDSNVRIDPLEELRELEGIARRQTGRRNVIPSETLLGFGADEGAASLALETWDDIQVDLSHPSLRGVEDVLEGLVSGCGADVFLEA